MKIEVLYFEGCPSHESTVELVRETTATLGIDASVTEVDVETDEAAYRLEFIGSPSVRVDGDDIEPGATTNADYGRRCRVYATENGISGVPPRDMLEAALRGEPYVSGEAAGEPVDCCGSTRTKVELLVAEWCPQCPAATTFWSGLSAQEEFELDVIDIESERGSKLAADHGIRAVPATIIDGQVAFRGTPVPDRTAALDRLHRSA